MKREIEIIDNEDVFNGFFRVEKVRLRYERFDGTMSDVITRLNIDRGDSVAVLVHDTTDECIILTEQFRYATVEKGPGWILELPAGIVEPGECTEATARREVREEIGYAVDELTTIATFYVSPGGTSERLHVFYAAVSGNNKDSAGGGVVSEGEDIRVVRVPVQEAIEKTASGVIVDAKTIIAIQWLQLNQRISRSPDTTS